MRKPERNTLKSIISLKGPTLIPNEMEPLRLAPIPEASNDGALEEEEHVRGMVKVSVYLSTLNSFLILRTTSMKIEMTHQRRSYDPVM